MKLEEKTVKITKTSKYSVKYLVFFFGILVGSVIYSVNKGTRTGEAIEKFKDLESRFNMHKTAGGGRRETKRILDLDMKEREEFIKFKKEEFDKNKFDYFEADSLD